MLVSHRYGLSVPSLVEVFACLEGDGGHSLDSLAPSAFAQSPPSHDLSKSFVLEVDGGFTESEKSSQRSLLPNVSSRFTNDTGFGNCWDVVLAVLWKEYLKIKRDFATLKTTVIYPTGMAMLYFLMQHYVSSTAITGPGTLSTAPIALSLNLWVSYLLGSKFGLNPKYFDCQPCTLPAVPHSHSPLLSAAAFLFAEQFCPGPASCDRTDWPVLAVYIV